MHRKIGFIKGSVDVPTCYPLIYIIPNLKIKSDTEVLDSDNTVCLCLNVYFIGQVSDCKRWPD